MKIGFKNAHEATTIIKFLVALGKEPYKTCSPEEYGEYLVKMKYSSVVLEDKTRCLTNPTRGFDFSGGGNNIDYQWSTDSVKIFELLVNPPLTITINNVGEYKAIVSKDDIKVGCQIISHEKFQEIVAAVEKVKAQ